MTTDPTLEALHAAVELTNASATVLREVCAELDAVYEAVDHTADDAMLGRRIRELVGKAPAAPALPISRRARIASALRSRLSRDGDHG